jgi:hypothetical protein
MIQSGAIAFRTIANDPIAQVIIPVTLRLNVWMMPWAVLPIPQQPYREGEQHNETIS